MKKIMFILVAFIGFSFIANAQQNYQDVVYLKSGSIVRGVIIEQVPNKSVKIETSDGNVFVYQIDEIEKMTKEAPKNRTKRTYGNSDFYETESGYRGSVDLGYAFKVGERGISKLKIHIINGSQLNPYFYLGFGTGVHYYPDAEAALLPLFVNLKANFLNSNFQVSPYFSLNAGYSFDLTNSFEPTGFLLNPNIGVSFKVNNKNTINIGVGFDMQWMKFVYSYSYSNYGYYGSYYDISTEMSGAISINVGFSF